MQRLPWSAIGDTPDEPVPIHQVSEMFGSPGQRVLVLMAVCPGREAWNPPGDFSAENPVLRTKTRP